MTFSGQEPLIRLLSKVGAGGVSSTGGGSNSGRQLMTILTPVGPMNLYTQGSILSMLWTIIASHAALYNVCSQKLIALLYHNLCAIHQHHSSRLYIRGCGTLGELLRITNMHVIVYNILYG